ncbi:Broad specificity phosphatase PhoE [Propionibacterium cyclohexanicum]|uniref:Broad specificity phosphatase PhoE n=1 Tax=Propionibacterium cyclohexanicum TaxID=64702 RepID=A0A1H9RTB3_9ACTN|nr:histidine phosphatase family protein [Propionibacterium cyclohexanicum]SER76080.1 Broad specificity phosphatase PhoE [Propionibacterium cyclohexanicum]
MAIERTLVHVVRHGEVHNPEGVLYERLPGYHLSRNGMAMATLLARHFEQMPITHLRVSPLLRARQTMQPIASGHSGVEVVVDDRLLEAASSFAGQRFGKYHQALLAPRNWLALRNPLRPSWGEPYTDIATRMVDALHDAAQAAGPGGQAIMVSHQSPIWILRLAMEGRRVAHLPTGRRCSLASVTTFHFLSGRCVQISYEEPAAMLLGKDGNSSISTGS